MQAQSGRIVPVLQQIQACLAFLIVTSLRSEACVTVKKDREFKDVRKPLQNLLLRIRENIKRKTISDVRNV